MTATLSHPCPRGAHASARSPMLRSGRPWWHYAAILAVSAQNNGFPPLPRAELAAPRRADRVGPCSADVAGPTPPGAAVCGPVVDGNGPPRARPPAGPGAPADGGDGPDPCPVPERLIVRRRVGEQQLLAGGSYPVFSTEEVDVATNAAQAAVILRRQIPNVNPKLIIEGDDGYDWLRAETIEKLLHKEMGDQQSEVSDGYAEGVLGKVLTACVGKSWLIARKNGTVKKKRGEVIKDTRLVKSLQPSVKLYRLPSFDEAWQAEMFRIRDESWRHFKKAEERLKREPNRLLWMNNWERHGRSRDAALARERVEPMYRRGDS